MANFLKIHFGAIFHSTMAVIPIFIIVNSVTEYLCLQLTGISVAHSFELKLGVAFGFRFHMIELGIFSCETFMIFFFYALIRPSFNQTMQPAIIVSIFSLLGIAFFLCHMMNLAIYPIKIASVFLVTTACSLSPSIIIGAFIFDKCVDRRVNL